MTPLELYELAANYGGRMIYPEEALALHEAARRVAQGVAPVIVEIGSYMGTSTVMLAAGASSGMVIAIDPHEGISDTTSSVQTDAATTTIGGLRKTLWATGVEGHVAIVSTYSSKAYPLVRNMIGERRIDLLFVDGSHREEDVYLDLSLYAPHVRGGGFLILDDLGYSTVAAGVARFGLGNYGFEPVDLRAWGLSDGVHKREHEGCLHKMTFYIRV